jgi:O-antigen ligase
MTVRGRAGSVDRGRQAARCIAAGPLTRHPPRGLTHAQTSLAFALFVFLAGQVPLTAAYESAGGVVAITRAGGLAMAFVSLYLCVSHERMSDVVRVLPYLLPFAVFLLYAGSSVIWSLEPGLTINRTIESYATVLFSGLWCSAAARVFGSERELCRWIAFAVIGFALYGLLVNVAVYGEPIKLALNREESTRLRLVFGGIHPLTLGDLMAIGAIVTVISDMRLRWKTIALLILLTLLQLTDATGARILFIVIIGVYLNMRAIRNRHAALWLALLWLGIFLAAGLTLLFEEEVIERLLRNERLSNLTGRSQLWSAIWQSGLANTWFGTGFDAAKGAIEDVFGVAFQVHNQYLGVLVELGYAGVFLFAAVFLTWVVVVVRSGSIMVRCLALYVVGINMNNASMFTKGSIIFLMILCYVSALFPVGASRRQLDPTSGRTAHSSGGPVWSGDRAFVAPARGLRR